MLAVNAFWWLPGVYLASTKGDSGFAFSHSSESVVERLAQIFWTEAPIQAILLAAGLPGLFLLTRRSADARAAALLGFCAAGMAWGYLAGASESLDFLQPGRHTFALYSGLAIAGGRRARGGDPAAAGRARRRSGPPRSLGRRRAGPDRACGSSGPSLVESVRYHLRAGEPFLSSRPSPRLLWVVDRVGRHVKPGERLLYEEGGKDLPGRPGPVPARAVQRPACRIARASK